MGDFANRLCGSSDLYNWSGKRPTASINFVTSHDGFSLRDLVSFNDKHNAANGENNQDGDNNNHSWNCGHEGLDAPEEVQQLRRRQMRNFLATLLLSQGVPMLRAGDEYGLTQQGNNNAYCQDNELSWLSWKRDGFEQQLERFTAELVKFRLKHPVFHQRDFFQGRDLRGSGQKDLTWINADGAEMNDEAWSADYAKVIGLVLCGDAIAAKTFTGEPVRDATFLLWFNAHHEDLEVGIPGERNVRWRQVIDTAVETGFVEQKIVREGGGAHILPARSFALFQQDEGSTADARNLSHARKR
jgi:glycogen operon protein